MAIETAPVLPSVLQPILADALTESVGEYYPRKSATRRAVIVRDIMDALMFEDAITIVNGYIERQQTA